MRYLCALIIAGLAFAAEAKLDLPGHPFKIAISQDGRWIFASLLRQESGDAAGIGVIQRNGDQLKFLRTIPLQPPATGIVLTHDDKLLIGSNGEGVVFLDVARIESGEGDPIVAILKEGGRPGSVYVNVTNDDKTLFVSDEARTTITVIDVPTRKVTGSIPVGQAPIALTFSPDQRWLYTTSQTAAPDWGWPDACDPENPRAKSGKHPEGAVIIVDVAKARTDPEHAAVSRAHAGCNPVRLAISKDGDRAYVTARKDNTLLAFDTHKLISDPDHAQTGSVAVGTAPVPVIVMGDRVIAGNSNRFGTAGSGDQSLIVVDRLKMETTGTIPAGLFPRDLVLSPDGKTLFLANFGSSSLQIVPLPR